MKRFICLFAAMMLAAPLFAQKTINLQITDTVNGGARYFVYHRIGTGNYVIADRKDAGTSKTYAYVLPAPIAVGTHYWSVTAYVVEGPNTIESGFSNEVSWVNPPVPPTLTITSVTASTTRKEAILSAEASAGTKAVFSYKMAGGWWQEILVDSDYSRASHQVVLANLRPHTPYQYQWTLTAEDGQTASAAGTFATK